MSEFRVLKLGGDIKPGRVIDLRKVCPEWDGRVSDKARAEIEANDRRAARVLQTAHLFWFGR
ncbi:hypothetical protein [Caulobacter sp. UC70_42]|uniref:hypothetical protein n=1 Tax=Caulobacter sp. UC70_42 TaxID=3374551 RepID=UPI0037562DA2